MVTRLLRLAEAPRPADAADALALAICQIWRGSAQAKIAAARCEGGPMIASVSGRVAALGPDGAVIEVGGVGLSVSCSPATLARLRVGETGRLATSLVVREDSLTLYGFADDDERGLFELLQTANGVGPKLAQTILAVLAAPRRPPRDRHGRLRDSGQGAGDRPQGGRTDRPRTAGPDRRDRRAGRRAARSPPSPPGVISSGTRWPASASRARRPTTRSTSSPPSTPTPRRTCRPCCGARSNSWGGPDEHPE